MKQNIGTIDSMVRITCGLTLLAWSIAKMANNKPSGGQLFVSMMGAQKVAEGIVHYCPLKEALGMDKSQSRMV
ncbi:YgaP family membrane protein [Planococcus sp. YIM B11945]|uniref:YgaP family membrane protein n=1 Tax=Planococcus sp. YIM B11945 TaxID=3435410 RepID=UPI003D7ED6CD